MHLKILSAKWQQFVQGDKLTLSTLEQTNIQALKHTNGNLHLDLMGDLRYIFDLRDRWGYVLNASGLFVYLFVCHLLLTIILEYTRNDTRSNCLNNGVVLDNHLNLGFFFHFMWVKSGLG